MLNVYFEYCRFNVAARGLLTDPLTVRSQFVDRAEGNGGQLYGIWRNFGGLGLRRDEGIALTAWNSEAGARAAALFRLQDLRATLESRNKVCCQELPTKHW